MKNRLSFLILLLFPGVFAALLYRPAPAAENPPEPDILIVRIYYDDQAALQTLATWREPWEVNEGAGYLVVEIRPVELEILRNAGYTVTVDRAQTAVANQPREQLPGQGPDTIPGFPCYRTVESTLLAGANMAANYPTLATWTDIGDSWEKVQSAAAGYDIYVLELTNSAIVGEKPKIFLLGAIHAREYATAELLTRFAEHMLAGYGSDPDMTWLLDHHEVHLVLQGNPDGRKIAENQTTNFHRKTTNDAACSALINPGIDLNRNFPFMWGFNTGSSSAGCNDTYRGTFPASEPETVAIIDYVRDEFPDQRDHDINAMAPITTTGMFLDIHAYGNVILWPWGPPEEDIGVTEPPNQAGFNALARRMGFMNGYAASKTLSYSVSGTTKDFAYGELGLAGYTIELGTTFHQSCSYFENIIVPDNVTMLQYAAKASRLPYALPFGPDAVNTALQGPAIVGYDVTLTALIDDARYGSGHANNPSGQVLSQPIASAHYYIDTPPWQDGAVGWPMSAADGIFDETSESVTALIDTAALSLGRHIIYVQGEDSDGDQGVASAIFLDVVSGEFQFLPVINHE